MSESLSVNQNSFQDQKYQVIQTLLPAPLLHFAYRYALKKADFGSMHPEDSQVSGTPADYGDPIMEMLLEELRPQVELASGLNLFATYAYFRVYQRGAVLDKHRDRPACEISVTLSLGGESGDEGDNQTWPILIENANGITAIHLNPGDALLYRGCEVAHWREAFEGNIQAQVFLHYVDQQGSYANWKFDQRETLSGCQGMSIRQWLLEKSNCLTDKSLPPHP